MYTQTDLNNIQRELRALVKKLGAALALFLAMYIFAVAKLGQWAMLLVLLTGFFVLAPLAVLRVLPLYRYRAFLQDLLRGTRHNTRGRIMDIGDAEKLQDGVRVYEVRLLREDGDERIFYINISKLAEIEKCRGEICIEHFGRHIAAVEGIE